MPFCTFSLLKYGQFFLCPKGRVSSRYGLPYKVRNRIRIYPNNRIRILSVWYGIRIFLKFKFLIRISAKDSEPHFPSCYRVNFVKRGRIHNIYKVNRSFALTVMRQKNARVVSESKFFQHFGAGSILIQRVGSTSSWKRRVTSDDKSGVVLLVLLWDLFSKGRHPPSKVNCKLVNVVVYHVTIVSSGH